MHIDYAVDFTPKRGGGGSPPTRVPASDEVTLTGREEQAAASPGVSGGKARQSQVLVATRRPAAQEAHGK